MPCVVLSCMQNYLFCCISLLQIKSRVVQRESHALNVADKELLLLKHSQTFAFLTTAANFGNGTYFAVNASYSAHDQYSAPDLNGKKYMYLARVLVGEYSLGKKGSITPARKNFSNSVELYDSSTDNVSQPTMFIIFNDIQAYPEYLITFTK